MIPIIVHIDQNPYNQWLEAHPEATKYKTYCKTMQIEN
jgi:hypothetical protein